MATNTERAVQLAFVENAVDISKKAILNPDKKTVKIFERLDKWLHACWGPIRDHQMLNEKAFMRRNKNVVGLAKKYNALTLQAILTASLLLAEDQHDDAPAKARKPWNWLVVALVDLYSKIDPDLSADADMDAGQRLGEAIQSL